MSARKMLRFLLCSALSLFFSPGASAVEYYWSNVTSGITGVGGTPEAAYLDMCNKNSSMKTLGMCQKPQYTIQKISDTQWLAKSYFASGAYNANHVVNRYGDSCPAASTWDPLEGRCKPDNQCQNLVGTTFPFSKSGTGPDDYMNFSADGKISIPQQAGCFNQCIASTLDQKCVAKVSGAYYCKGTAEYTGAQCGSSGTSPVEEDSTPDTPLEPKTETVDKPCIYSADGSGAQVCQSEKSSESEGQHCGEVNGVKKCFDAAPKKDSTKVDSKVTSTTGADGGTTTTKTDTASTTKCDGVNKCTTSTTTNTTTTKKDGSGTTTSVSGSCSGSQCPSKNGNPDGDGDGFGDCVGENCAVTGGTGEGDGVVSGESCDVALACSGDAIQCAILRQEKEHRCAQEAFQTVTPEEEHQLRTDLETEFAGEEYQPLAPTEESTFNLSSMLDTSREFSGSCPSVPDFSFDLNGGAVTVPVSEIISQLCQYLIWFGYFVVAFAMRAAAEIVAKGMN